LSVAAPDLNTLTHPEVLRALGELERSRPRELGAKSWQAVLSERLRIGGVEVHRRLGEAKEWGSRCRGAVGTGVGQGGRRPGRRHDRGAAGSGRPGSRRRTTAAKP